jgi:hypothetical protein
MQTDSPSPHRQVCLAKATSESNCLLSSLNTLRSDSLLDDLTIRQQQRKGSSQSQTHLISDIDANTFDDSHSLSRSHCSGRSRKSSSSLGGSHDAYSPFEGPLERRESETSTAPTSPEVEMSQGHSVEGREMQGTVQKERTATPPLYSFPHVV